MVFGRAVNVCYPDLNCAGQTMYGFPVSVVANVIAFSNIPCFRTTVRVNSRPIKVP